jgi:hypothetical protein
MTKHTPGPWTVNIHDIARDGVWVCGPGESGYEIVTVAEGQEDGQREANACLIAAAPEMLAIIRQVVEIADGKALHRGLEDDARALLSRIEGA